MIVAIIIIRDLHQVLFALDVEEFDCVLGHVKE